MEGFRHKTSIVIRFVDMDVFGHVNNANYLTYFEEARIKYSDDVIEYEYDWSKHGLILAKADINFRSPAHFRDEVSIYTRCIKIGTKSFSCEQAMFKNENGKEVLMASCSTVVVAFDYDKNDSIPVPDEWRAALRKYEENESL